MNILAIETTSLHGSVALLQNGAPIVHWLSGPRRHTAELLPMIETILEEAELRPEQLDLLAWSAGPGSFTGLRVGATVVRTLGWARKIPVSSVPTLDVIVHNLLDAQPPLELPGRPIVVMQDALRGEVFAAVYERSGDTITCVQSAAGVDPRVWLASIEQPIVLGSGVPQHEAVLQEQGAQILDEELWLPHAGWVARLGQQQHAGGLSQSPDEVMPAYHRRPSCEEDYERRRAEAIARRSTTNS